MNTDTVEWHFADARQMVRGSTNKLSATAFDIADKKAGCFNAANFSLLGNNANGVNAFGRRNDSKLFIINTIILYFMVCKFKHTYRSSLPKYVLFDCVTNVAITVVTNITLHVASSTNTNQLRNYFGSINSVGNFSSCHLTVN